MPKGRLLGSRSTQLLCYRRACRFRKHLAICFDRALAVVPNPLCATSLSAALDALFVEAMIQPIAPPSILGSLYIRVRNFLAAIYWAESHQEGAADDDETEGSA